MFGLSANLCIFFKDYLCIVPLLDTNKIEHKNNQVEKELFTSLFNQCKQDKNLAYMTKNCELNILLTTLRPTLNFGWSLEMSFYTIFINKIKKWNLTKTVITPLLLQITCNIWLTCKSYIVRKPMHYQISFTSVYCLVKLNILYMYCFCLSFQILKLFGLPINTYKTFLSVFCASIRITCIYLHH